MSDVQSRVVQPEEPTAASGGEAAESGAPRRLLSLASQMRRTQERAEAAPKSPSDQPSDRPRPEAATGAGAEERQSRPPVPRRHDPLDDPMARAMALLSGIDEHVRDAERPNSPAQAAPGESDPAARSVAPTREEGPEIGAEKRSPFAHLDSLEPLPALQIGEHEEVIRREDASPVGMGTAPRRQIRALYSLQEVHERTGIPYATLALYAASHADRIPSLGERRSPAYPREGLEAFCHIHAERNPGWQAPAPGTEQGWDDEVGLARRIDALHDGLASLQSDLREIQAVLARGWSAEVSLFD